jgi:hypothetical protein
MIKVVWVKKKKVERPLISIVEVLDSEGRREHLVLEDTCWKLTPYIDDAGVFFSEHAAIEQWNQVSTQFPSSRVRLVRIITYEDDGKIEDD